MTKTFIDRHFGLIAVIMFCVVALFVGILFVQIKNTVELDLDRQATVVPTATPDDQAQISATPAPQKYPTDLGKRIPGTTEDIPIIASPKSPDDVIAMVRWYVENGEVIDLQITGYVNLGACGDTTKFTKNEVCVDIAKNGTFNQGENLGTVKVRWSDTGTGMIYRLEGDGYYNGKVTSYSYQKNNKITIEAGTFGKVAGESVPSTSITFPTIALILISLGSVLVFAAGIGLYLNIQVNKKNNSLEAIQATKRSNQTFQIVVISGLFVLAGGVLFAANWLAVNKTSPDESQALVTSPTPLYVTILVTQTVTPSGVLTSSTPSVTITVSATPTATHTPTVTPTVTTTSTPTPTPQTTRLPVSDNTPVLCGPLDVDGNKALNIVDYNAMVVVYNLTCTDSPYAHVGCWGKDTNDDARIDYKDLYYLVTHYYPGTADCTR